MIPHPREFATQGKKKNANVRGSAWAQLELTDALVLFKVINKQRKGFLGF